MRKRAVRGVNVLAGVFVALLVFAACSQGASSTGAGGVGSGEAGTEGGSSDSGGSGGWSGSALQDNFNDQQNTRGTALWMFTDDADVAGVSPSNPTSAIWWVGPLTSNGYPPAGAPTTRCINYTSAMAMCP